jgi:hypothetical protein
MIESDRANSRVETLSEPGNEIRGSNENVTERRTSIVRALTNDHDH